MLIASETLTQVLAIVGTATGVIGLLLGLRQLVLDRPQIGINAGPLVHSDGTAQLKVTVENHGRQPVVVGPAGFAWHVEDETLALEETKSELVFDPGPWVRQRVDAGDAIEFTWDAELPPYVHLDVPLRVFAEHGRKRRRTWDYPYRFYRALANMGWTIPEGTPERLTRPLAELPAALPVEARWKVWKPRDSRGRSRPETPPLPRGTA